MLIDDDTNIPSTRRHEIHSWPDKTNNKFEKPYTNFLINLEVGP